MVLTRRKNFPDEQQPVCWYFLPQLPRCPWTRLGLFYWCKSWTSFCSQFSFSWLVEQHFMFWRILCSFSSVLGSGIAQQPLFFKRLYLCLVLCSLKEVGCCGPCRSSKALVGPFIPMCCCLIRVCLLVTVRCHPCSALCFRISAGSWRQNRWISILKSKVKRRNNLFYWKEVINQWICADNLPACIAKKSRQNISSRPAQTRDISKIVCACIYIYLYHLKNL